MGALVLVHILQFVFIAIQLPFNDRIENLLQAFVTMQQGIFFMVLMDAAMNPQAHT